MRPQIEAVSEDELSPADPRVRAAERATRALLAAQALELDQDPLELGLLAFGDAIETSLALRIGSRLDWLGVVTAADPREGRIADTLRTLSARIKTVPAPGMLLGAPLVLPEVRTEPSGAALRVEAVWSQPTDRALDLLDLHGLPKVARAAAILGAEAHALASGSAGRELGFCLPAARSLRDAVLARVEAAMAALDLLPSHLELARGLHGALALTSPEVICRLRVPHDGPPELSLEYAEVSFDDMIRLWSNFHPAPEAPRRLAIVAGAAAGADAGEPTAAVAGLEVCYRSEDPPDLSARFELGKLPCTVGLRAPRDVMESR